MSTATLRGKKYDLANEKQCEAYWTTLATKCFVGRTIINVFYMPKKNAKEMGWYNRPIVLVLDNEDVIIPYSDDEGNNGGVLTTTKELIPVL